ncbi:MAG: AAA family ATPase [Bacteroidales bacterium]|nr:AAA family ATPase [Bacteroidales bacterium]
MHKLIHDNIPDVRVVVTGSSAFELVNKINEPLTGRKTELFLFPLAFNELVGHTSLLEEKRFLEHRMIFILRDMGGMPRIITFLHLSGTRTGP